MSKYFKAASSVGTVALVLSGSVMAAAPAFDNWSVSSGTISTSACQTGYSCGSAMTDLGFFQRMVTTNDGTETFFQTIITENNATAANSADLDNLIFSDESFVRTGNVNGIADKQRITENPTLPNTTTFKASTQLSSGWAGTGIVLKQYLMDSADGFQTDFIFQQKGSNSNPTATGMKITAFVPIQGTDKQDFVLVQLSGDYANASSNPSGDNNTVTIPGTPNQVMSWTKDTSPGAIGTSLTEGDAVKAIWIGQDLSTIVGQQFGFTSYTNLTDPQFISTFSLTSMAPVAWDEAVWGLRDTRGTPNGTPVSNPFPAF